MKKRVKVALLLMGVLTVIYAVALYLSIQRYNAWAQDLIAEYEAKGIPSGYIDFYPYYATFEGKLLMSLAMGLIVSWGVSILLGGGLNKT